jgi:hypothetical protein
MNRRQVFSVIVAAPLVGAQTKQPSIRERLLGAWKLISWEATLKPDGKIDYPCGKKPIGRITYDAAGRMAAQIMDTDRRVVGRGLGWSAMLRAYSAVDLREIVGGYRAYFGTYEIDKANRSVIHHVQGELRPAGIGEARRRTFEFVGDDRILLSYSDTEGDNRLLWERDRG